MAIFSENEKEFVIDSKSSTCATLCGDFSAIAEFLYVRSSAVAQSQRNCMVLCYLEMLGINSPKVMYMLL